ALPDVMPEMDRTVRLVGDALVDLDYRAHRDVVVLRDEMAPPERIDADDVELLLFHEFDEAPDRRLVRFDDALAHIRGDLELELVFGDDGEPIADVGGSEVVMLHCRLDSLVHGISIVFEIYQQDAKRPDVRLNSQDRLAGGHRERLGDHLRAFSGPGHRR